jgi:site-specific recombinase XerD
MNVTFNYLVTSFFTTYLANERGLSGNTIASYSDCMRLLIKYACDRFDIELEKVSMEMFTVELVLDFLDSLENERHNQRSSRNVRLAAIKSFFHFLARTVPELMHLNESIQAIRSKKTEHAPPPSLTVDEVDAILAVPDPSELLGSRDLALLQLFVNTGARVQEVADLKVADVRFEAPPTVTLTGKGRKKRIVPLWQETVDIIRNYLNMKQQADIVTDTLFVGIGGNPMTRFGIGRRIGKHAQAAAANCPSLTDRQITPHVFRHTTALNLIEANNDITLVRDWLGHADIRTTSQYVEVSIERKRRALEKVPAPTAAKKTEQPIWKKNDVMDFLCKLSRVEHNVA